MGLKLWNIYRLVHFVCHCKLVFIFHISLFVSLRSHGNSPFHFFLLCKWIHLSICWPFLDIFPLTVASCKRMQRTWSWMLPEDNDFQPDLESMMAQSLCRILKYIHQRRFFYLKIIIFLNKTFGKKNSMLHSIDLFT